MLLQMSKLLIANRTLLKIAIFVILFVYPFMFLQMPLARNALSARITNILFSIMLRIIMSSVFGLSNETFAAMFTMHHKFQLVSLRVDHVIRFAVELFAAHCAGEFLRLLVNISDVSSER